MDPDRFPESNAVRAWRLELEARGEARGEVRALTWCIRTVLERRGVTVEPHHREKIAQCEDPDTLHRWFDRAFTAQNVDEVFRD